MTLPADIVARVSRRLAEHAGLELPAWVVEARALGRMAAVGCEPHVYAELIASARGARELDELIEAVRVGESSLFRHRQQITTLTDAVVPALRLRKRRVVQVWSAGCAAGQEPYTLAVVLSRALPGVQLSIVATDVSAEALDAGRANRYPRDALDDVPEAYRDAFVIDPVRDVVRVRPDLASLVRFERANLVEPRRGESDSLRADAGRFDIVWCRNVLIYFSADARRRAIERLIASTTFGGFIFVGYSESLRDVGELDPLRFGDAVYYTRRDVQDGPRPARAAGPSVARDSARRLATPPAGLPVVPAAAVAIVPPKRPEAQPEVIVLTGTPDPRALTAALAARFAEPHARVVIDFDGAELLDDALAPVLRRAIAAARAAGGELVLRATRTGGRRWLTRHALERLDGGAS